MVLSGARKCYCLGLLLAGLAGCGDDLGGREEIRGTVTLQGQPLDEGSIEFTPLEPPPPGEPETNSGAPITQGSYHIPRAQGLVPGKYRVRISAGVPVEGPPPGELPSPTFGLPPKDRVPAKYNTESELEATVTAAGPNDIKFDIP